MRASSVVNRQLTPRPPGCGVGCRNSDVVGGLRVRSTRVGTVTLRSSRAEAAPRGTVALSRNVPGKPSNVEALLMAGRQERVEPLDRAYDLSSFEQRSGSSRTG
jgi:hypothetical protein